MIILPYYGRGGERAEQSGILAELGTMLPATTLPVTTLPATTLPKMNSPEDYD